MAIDLSTLSIAEIQHRFAGQSGPLPASLLIRMERDPRAGVRQICGRLRARQERAERERQRVESMQRFERLLWGSGARCVAGVDEAGMGPLAGPVVAAAVVFPPGTFISAIDDSKKIPAGGREQLALAIRAAARGVGIGLADVGEIDELNVYHAGILAMHRAVADLPRRPDHLLLDARQIPEISIPQDALVKGDTLSFSIAAASIVAKTWRDRLMRKLDRRFPQYGFLRHKGYSTQEHQEAIKKYGPSPVHRKSFTFIRELCGQYSPLFYALRERLRKAVSEEAVFDFEGELQARGAEIKAHERRKIRLLVRRRRAALEARCPDG